MLNIERGKKYQSTASLTEHSHGVGIYRPHNRIFPSAATILLLVLLAWQCLDIYWTGNSPSNLDENGLHIQSVYRAEDVITRLKALRIWAVGNLVYALLQ